MNVSEKVKKKKKGGNEVFGDFLGGRQTQTFINLES